MALLSFSRKLNAELEAKTASLIKEAEDVLVLAHAVYSSIICKEISQQC
jgi:cellobiose-specific phosphotransferase system component IIA